MTCSMTPRLSLRALLSMTTMNLRWLACVFCLMTVPAVAIAQTVTGTISGGITDTSGALIAGAKVTLVNEHTGDVRTLTTSADGRFVFSAVQPDSYTIKIEKPGFGAIEQRAFVLSTNEDLALGEFQLKAGQVTEVVTVSAGGAKVELESSDLTSRLTSDQISLLSTKGRDITSLLRLMPGTSYVDDVETVGEGFGTNLPNFSGQRGRSATASVDGLNGNDPSGSNKLSMTINQDAIEEVKVLRNNYAAEFGNNGGAMVNLITKSGGKDYHGSAYYFLRNEALNANTYINNNTVDPRTGGTLPRPLYRHNIWGVTLGGPVQIPRILTKESKQRVFFFYSYEKPHTISPQATTFVTMPNALERQGDFSHTLDSSNRPVFIADPTLVTAKSLCQATPTTKVDPTISYQGACFHDLSRATPGNPTGINIIPVSRFNANGRALLNYFPLPNAPSGNVICPACNYVVQRSVDVPKWSQVIRLDFEPLQSDHFSLKGQQWTSDNVGFSTSGWPGGTPPDANVWGISSHYLYKDDGVTAGWTHIFNQRMVNEVNIGIRHDIEGFIPSTGVIDSLSRATLGYTAPQIFPQNNLLGTVPRVTGWSSVAGRPANINWTDRWGEAGSDHIFPSVADNLSINRGSHDYKVGAYFENLINTEAPGGNWSGTFNFGTSSTFTNSLGSTGYAYSNALLGNFNSYTESSTRPHTNLQVMLLQWYAQDQWKINSRVTLNYGLRMGFNTQFYQRDQQASNFDPSRFDPAKAPLLYQPYCKGGTPALGTACATSNRFAVDPRNMSNPTSSQLLNANLVRSFVPGTGDPLNGLVLQSDPGTPAGFKKVQPINWEPRVGFAWSLSESGKTVLRAMGGIYHSPRVGGGTTGGNLVSNAPYQRSLTFNNGNIDNLANLISTSLVLPTALNSLEVVSQTPTTYSYSLGIQRDIGFGTVVEATYVGSQSRHLGETRNINVVPDGARFLDVHPENRDPFSTNSAKNDDFLRRYSGYTNINQVSYTGSSNYNGLQAQLNRRYARRIQYGVVYTWSKTMDYANDDSSSVNSPRPYRQFNYAPANFDQTHILTLHYIWDLPTPGGFLDHPFIKAVLGNWQASGITSFVSGQPKSVTVTYNTGTVTSTGLAAVTDLTGGEVNAVPNVICNPNEGGAGSSSAGLPILINTSCFAKPDRGDIGNARRNLLRLPGLITTDLAVFKNMHMTEKTSLQFRWETYNLLNHTNFSDIDAAMKFDANGVQTSQTFGAPTSVRPPRVMQGSLRFSF